MHLICKGIKNFNIIELLVKNGVNVNIIDNTFNTPLHYIVDNHNDYDYHYDNEIKEIVKLLINHGANLFGINNKKKNILDKVRSQGMNHFIKKNYYNKILNDFLNKNIANIITNYIYT